MTEYFVTKRIDCPGCKDSKWSGISPVQEIWMVCGNCNGSGKIETKVTLQEALRDIHIQQAKNDPEAPSFLRAV